MSGKVKRRRFTKSCSVFGCDSVYIPKAIDDNISFHQFPKHPEIRKQWILACKRADKFNLGTACVCSKHFSKSDFERDLKSELMEEYKPKRMLKPGVVPHLKLPGKPEKESAIKRQERYAKKIEKEEREKFIRSILEEGTPPLNPDPNLSVLPILSTNSPSVHNPNLSVHPILSTNSPSVQERPILPSNSNKRSQPSESDVYEQLRLLQTKVSFLEKRLEEEKKFRLEMCKKPELAPVYKLSQLQTIVEDSDDTENSEETITADELSYDSDDSLEDSDEEKETVVLDLPTENEAKPSFACSTCDSFFDSWELLNQHITNQHFEVDLRDQVKDFLIESIEMEDKIEDKVGECKVCKGLFTLKALRKHQQTHDKERPHICSFCDKTFVHLSHVKRHELIHTGEKRFKCDTCPKAFAHKSNLKLHERVHSRKLKCRFRFCNQRFPFRRSLLHHERTHKNGPFDCLYCEKSFSKILEFRFHEMTHTNQKPFRCSECRKEFLSKHSLQTHMIMHTENNPFKCEICDRMLCSKGSLLIHMRSHTGEKPYKCNVCHFSTAFVGTLKCHMRTHSGERPYKCQFCKRSFSYNHSLKIHEQTHSVDKLYKCKWCIKQFTTSTKLKIHSKKTHPYELEEEQNLAT